jgi:hypothetical protein
MSITTEHYERLIQEEHLLANRLETCEDCITAILSRANEGGIDLHVLTLEDILTTIHQIWIDIQVEMLHLRFEKALQTTRI